MSLPTLEYYSDLLILQYRTKERAVETVQLLANQAYIGGFPLELEDCFDLETAVGPQLTILGRIVGVPRNVYTLDNSHLYFNFIDYDYDDMDPPPTYGFGDYEDDPYDPDGYLFYSYNFHNATIYTLLDFELRLLIKLKILLNNSYSSTKEIKDAIYTFFSPEIDVIDNADMTLTYNISSSLSNVGAAAVSLGLLPKPMGVGLDINYV